MGIESCAGVALTQFLEVALKFVLFPYSSIAATFFATLR
jgi:hypothetical protein